MKPNKGKFTGAMIERQKVLDWLIDHPESTPVEIAKATNTVTKSCSIRLRKMARWGELQRTEHTSRTPDRNGRIMVHKTFTYSALIDKTRDERDVLLGLVSNLKHGERQEVIAKPKPTISFGKATRNERFYDPTAKPLKGQGGQGSYGVMPRMKNVMLGE